MPKYTIQRPLTVWVETIVEDFDTLEDALEVADENFKNGDYIELDGTFSIDYDRYWSQDSTGEVKYA
jgi:hypothetical protein